MRRSNSGPVVVDSRGDPHRSSATANAIPRSVSLPAALLLLASVGAIGLTAAGRIGPAPKPAHEPAQAPSLSEILEACDGPNPYFVVTCLFPGSREFSIGGETAVVAVNRRGEKRELVTQHHVGAVYGVAYDTARRHLYTAAVHKWATIFGPGGPGAIYRTDLATGLTEPFAMLDAGPDEHVFTDREPWSDHSKPWVGRTSLGDLEIDEAGARLFVTNLRDRRIHRISLPGGALDGAFDHGASAEPWAANARPFGLGFRDGWLYHGVVDSREDPSLPGSLAGHVYRSLPDGSEMRRVAVFALDYPRSEEAWQPWSPFDSADRCDQPVISDIDFRPSGELIIGLRNLGGDAECGHQGDILSTRALGDAFDVITEPEWYDDATLAPEAAWGGLAAHPALDHILTTVVDPKLIRSSAGILLLDNATGGRITTVELYRTPPGTIGAGGFGKSQGLGDAESLCRSAFAPTPSASPRPSDPATPTSPPTPTPAASFTPTDTATHEPAPSATATPPASPTAGATVSPAVPAPTSPPTATPTASATATERAAPPGPIFLPVALSETCPPKGLYVDVALVIDASTSMRDAADDGRRKIDVAVEAASTFVDGLRMGGVEDRVAIVSFDATARTLGRLTSDPAAAKAALRAIEVAEGSRVDLGLRQATSEIVARARPGHVHAMVVLSDGKVNGTERSRPGQEAALARRADISVYVVGMGPSADEVVLAQMAGTPEYLLPAPSPAWLLRIYTELSTRVPCPPSRFWSRRE